MYCTASADGPSRREDLLGPPLAGRVVKGDQREELAVAAVYATLFTRLFERYSEGAGQGATVAYPFGDAFVDDDCGHRPDGDVWRVNYLVPRAVGEVGLGFFEREGLVDVKRAVPRSRKLSEMSAAAERLSEIVGKRAHVEAPAARNVNDQVGGRPVHHVDAQDVHGARLALHLDAKYGLSRLIEG